MTATPASPTALPARAAVRAVATGWGRREAVIGVVLLAAFVGVFWRWFSKQNEHSLLKLDDWGHAYVVPLFAGYMIWRQRAELSAMTPKPFWPGLLPVLLGMMCYFFFVVGVANHMLQGAAVVLTLAASSSLSAAGSSHAPRSLFWPMVRAANPSRASVRPATTNVASAQPNSP